MSALNSMSPMLFYGTDRDLHGARLDVYIEPEERCAEGKVTVYDIEPDCKDSAADIKLSRYRQMLEFPPENNFQQDSDKSLSDLRVRHHRSK